jgi:ATP-binding cassette subfamily F protein uup
MDEPTNDLDIETLELLEEVLLEFKGTLLLVSHDRAFMDNVITSTLVLDGTGRVAEYVGSYTETMQQIKNAALKATTPPSPSVKKLVTPAPPAPAQPTSSKKLSYKDQQELDAIPDKMEILETEQMRLTEALSKSGLYQNNPEKARQLNNALHHTSTELDQLMERWAELEG